MTIPHHTGPGMEGADDGRHSPDRAYAVGHWWGARHPEIAVTGLAPPVATQFIHLLAAEVGGGVRCATGDRLTGFRAGCALVFRASAPHTATARLRQTARFHEQRLPFP